MPRGLEISSDDFKAIQGFLCDACGIVLNEGKEYLIKSRLANVLYDTDYKSFSDLAKAIRLGNLSLGLQARIVDAMTTNETFWFRDPNQFDVLQKTILPDLMKSRVSANALRIWSAACSSGQEPYSISMCVEETLRSQSLERGLKKTVQIMGTDISASVLEEAKRSVYNDLALSRGLSQDYRTRYFNPFNNGFKLNETITSRVRFQQFNLLKSYTALGKFDVIFCRNVLIYFSEEVKRDMVSRMAQALNPGGYFFLSSTEALPREVDSLESAGTSSVRYFRLKS